MIGYFEGVSACGGTQELNFYCGCAGGVEGAVSGVAEHEGELVFEGYGYVSGFGRLHFDGTIA